jgi:hypothetical protein
MKIIRKYNNKQKENKVKKFYRNKNRDNNNKNWGKYNNNVKLEKCQYLINLLMLQMELLDLVLGVQMVVLKLGNFKEMRNWIWCIIGFKLIRIYSFKMEIRDCLSYCMDIHQVR